MPDSLTAVKSIIDAPIVEGIPADYLVDAKRANSQIVVELGADYKTITTPDSFSKLLYTAPTPKPATPADAGPEKPLNSTDTTATGTSTTTSSTSTTKTTSASGTATTAPAKTTPATEPVKTTP